MTGMPVITVYSRPGCHLCETLIEALLPKVRGRATVEVVDIDTRPDWHDAYALRIPVVELDDRFVCQYVLDEAALADAMDSIPATPA
jgi:hypothetical protein